MLVLAIVLAAVVDEPPAPAPVEQPATSSIEATAAPSFDVATKAALQKLLDKPVIVVVRDAAPARGVLVAFDDAKITIREQRGELTPIEAGAIVEIKPAVASPRVVVPDESSATTSEPADDVRRRRERAARQERDEHLRDSSRHMEESVRQSNLALVWYGLGALSTAIGAVACGGWLLVAASPLCFWTAVPALAAGAGLVVAGFLAGNEAEAARRRSQASEANADDAMAY